jgi:hypothetical protein
LKNFLYRWLAFGFLFASVVCQAQNITATLFGTVTDQTGAILPNASVAATNVGTGLKKTATTDGSGGYRIELLPVGEYSIEITAAGFGKTMRTGITPGVSETVRIDVALVPGSVTQSIEVTSAAALINTANAEVGTTVANVLVTQLPIVDRNTYALLDVIPGVRVNSSGLGGTPDLGAGFPREQLTLNGGINQGDGGSINFLLDGGQNTSILFGSGNSTPSPDAVREFRVQADNYSADTSRFPAGVVSVITKSGSNSFHGSGFEFWRNDELNAKNWKQIARNGPLHKNLFGGTLGGPIIKNRTFFFGSYAGLRLTQSAYIAGTGVPTPLERNADGSGYNFSASQLNGVGGKLPTDPFNVVNGKPQPFTCNGLANTICANRVDPVALKILNQFVPNGNSSPGLWQGQIPLPSSSNEYLGKLDHRLTASHQLALSYLYTIGSADFNSGSSGLPYSLTAFDYWQHNVNLSDTWTLNSSTINQAWLTYNREIGGRISTPAESLADLGSAFAQIGPASLPSISVTGYFGLGQQISGPKAGSNFYSARDLVSTNKGRHALRFGAEVDLSKDMQYVNLTNYGVFQFNGSMTGNGFADFLLGIPNFATQQAPVTAATDEFVTSLFAQDDYRATPRLTLNLGIRWDMETPPTDPANRQATYVPGSQSTVRPLSPVGLLYPGDKGVPRGIAQRSYLHFSPRVGFAYDLSGNGRSALRGGFGVFWGGPSGTGWNQSSNSQPFTLSLSFPNVHSITGATLSDPYRNYPGGNPINLPHDVISTGSNIKAIDLGYMFPYTYQMNLAVQQQFTNSFAMTVAYVGSLSHHLPLLIDQNYPGNTPTATSNGLNVLSRRPQPLLGQVQQWESVISTNYHSLQVTGQKQMGNGLSFVTSYVWSKTLEGAHVEGTGGVPEQQDPNNLAAEYARADTDFRSVFSTGLVWQIDYLHSGNFVVRHVVNGWQISPIFKAISGGPITLLNVIDANFDGNIYDRPNQIGDPHVQHRTANEWFNTAAFVQNNPVMGHPIDGTARRNDISLPGSELLALGLARSFQIHETVNLQFRAEANNALNHVNLGAPATSLNTSTFGMIFFAGQMRQLQLGARLTF